MMSTGCIVVRRRGLKSLSLYYPSVVSTIKMILILDE